MIVEIGKLKLSAQCALLGNVFSELRAVCVESKENLISVYFHINGEISDDQRDLCECVLDEIIADFNLSEEIRFEAPIIRIDYPQTLPIVGYRVYRRYEA